MMRESGAELSFLFHQDVQRIFNNFTALFRIRIAFFSPDGRELKVGQDRDLCRYCRLIRSCPGGAAACMDEDRLARLKAAEKNSLLVYKCHAGMTEAVKPLYRDNALIGFAMIGQIRTQENPPARWESAWALRKSGRQSVSDGESLAGAFLETPCTGPADLPRILELFSDLTDLMAERHLIESRHADRLTNLLAAIRNGPEQDWSLTAAAETVHLSPSRLSHLIKERYGMPLTRLVRRIRMDHARICLVRYPDRSVKEIAAAVGMSDARYFSRLFRRETGMTPREYRTSGTGMNEGRDPTTGSAE